ncbi:TetR/AcrR family transcriptional regulator [Roseomonas hellenica]|uniref:TetR/AcrR family transcriptional regulator n=1 Tax=Plastoroseomonas hellenica TaxID=2687306 RepID=UPI001BA663E0|nr:TetR/AcrR family transcriptional regulator [Plastoroseomonas hellenica]MBR0641218.1 TetR/AcrR family transcriptional regulator [Plastoroseomonas hellenica]
MRDLIERTGITGASLYNAFGDKRALYQRALDHYVAGSRPAGAGVAQGCRCDGSRLP